MVPVCHAAADDGDHYRVELLVLRHLDSTATPDPEPFLRDYTGALDLVPPEPAEGAATADEPPGTAATQVIEAATAEPGIPDAGSPAGVPVPEDAAAAVPAPAATWIETPGDVMQEAWRRLRLSAGFRPELYFSWQQPDTEPFPEIRVHDAQLVWVDDPFAELRSSVEAAESVPATQAPVDAAPGAADPNAPDTAALLPEPIRYYRIDGTARLRRSRFLHLELDLEWREPVFAGPMTEPGASSAAVTQPPIRAVPAPAVAAPATVHVHRLRQSRPVRTGQVEYFDGPFLGILAVVTRLELPAEDAAPIPGQP